MKDKMIPYSYHLTCPGERRGVYQWRTGNVRGNLNHGDGHMFSGWSQPFPGPLLSSAISCHSSEMQKEDLVAFIQMKSQKCLLRVAEPEQKEAYFFWMIMELFCNQNGNVTMAEVSTSLCKGYNYLRKKTSEVKKKLVGVRNPKDWCLSLACVLCSAAPDNEKRHTVLEMADRLACRGQTFAAHICYVVAQVEVGAYSDSSFDLIGCDRLPFSKSAIWEAIQRTEVYEYVLFLTSGFAQPIFQKYKVLYATMLAKAGLSALALEYCESIARAVTMFPSSITATLMEDIIVLSEMLHYRKAEEPKWLLNLRWLHVAKAHQEKTCNFPKPYYKIDPVEFLLDAEHPMAYNRLQDFERSLIPGSYVQVPMELYTTPEELFASRYTVGQQLGLGGFGYIYAGVRNADRKKVAIKYVAKTIQDKYVHIPGEMRPLPLEVALMQMASLPPRCENVVDLLEWFDMPTWVILILERPSPCMDLQKFCRLNNGRLPEKLVRDIMWQVVQAARHCCYRGVLHRDIKAENLLINTETLQVKLIDFGCGDLLKNTPYTKFAGTRAFLPPEWICNGWYLGCPATVWNLGMFLYYLASGRLPFNTNAEIADGKIPVNYKLSRECRNLISWCLKKDPRYRATLEDIVRHKWFTVELSRGLTARKD